MWVLEPGGGSKEKGCSLFWIVFTGTLSSSPIKAFGDDDKVPERSLDSGPEALRE
jgi:hypothetical protein